jgi:hypothetical protein
MNTPLNQLLLSVKTPITTFVLSHPLLLEIVLKKPALAKALLTPARVVVLVSNQSIRKR